MRNRGKQGEPYMRPNSTSAMERKLADELEALGFKVVRSAIFGTAMVDIYLPDYHIVVEVDGPHHVMKGKKDIKKDGYLREFGLVVYRITWLDIEGGHIRKEAVKELRRLLKLFRGDAAARSLQAVSHRDAGLFKED